MKVVIIIPTYNERENIGPLIEVIENEIFPQIKNHEMHILVVDDSSPDETHKIVQEKMKDFTNLHLVIGGKQGLGAAYIRGMDYAVNQLGAEVIFEMDADFSHDPKKIPEFLEKIDQGYDFVVGSRYIKGGSIPENWGIHRKLFSITGNLMVRIILGRLRIHDWTSGYRAIRKEVFQKTLEKLYGFAGYTFQVVLLYNALKNGAKVVEVPINFIDRRYGQSKIKPFDYIKNLLFYVVKMRLAEIFSPTFKKYLVVGSCSFIINALALEFFYRLGLRPRDAAALGAEFSIVFNFTVNNLWTFAAQRITSWRRIPIKFFQFNLTSFGAIVIQWIVVGLGTFFFGDQARFIFLVIAVGCFVIPYNYTMYTVVIWKTKKIPWLSWMQKLAG